MRKIKKFKVIVSYIVLVGLSLQSFPLFAGQKRINQKPSPAAKPVAQSQKEKKEEAKQNIAAPVMQEFQQCALKTDADGKNTICIDCPELEKFVAIIVKDAVTGGKEANLSGNLLLFCEKVLTEKKDFSPEELSLAMPELLSLLSEKIEQTKAPRLDAPGSADGSIVGPLIDCNLDEVIALLNQIIALINQCCAMIFVDFNGVFTTLVDIKNTLTIDFNGTFTALFDIKNTLTIDFNGTFTELTEIFNTLTVDFAGTFTELDDIFNTLTTCCDGTFTALAEITVDANGTFTELTEIFNTLTVDFAGTFTELDDIFNTLTTCCNGTFTELADIKNTLTIDFNGTFTELDVIVIDLNGTFTELTVIESNILS
jgi:hypothetical protein